MQTNKTPQLLIIVFCLFLTSFSLMGCKTTTTEENLHSYQNNLFTYGLTPVKIDGKYGYIDPSNTLKIPATYDVAGKFTDNGLALVGTDEQYGFIDTTGTLVIPLQFDIALPFNYSDTLTFVMVEDRIGMIDNNGVYLVNPLYDDLRFSSMYDDEEEENIDVTDIIMVQKDGKWGGLDITGTIVIPFQFDEVDMMTDNVISVAVGDSHGVIDKTGKYIVNPQYEESINFYNGYAEVSYNGRYGYVNEAGQLVINYQFDEAYPFSKDGYACVKIGNSYGLINTSGTYVVNPQFTSYLDPNNGLASIKVNDKFGYIDLTGTTVIAPQFDAAMSFDDNGLAWVRIGEVYGLINESGTYVVNPLYEDYDDFDENGLACIMMNDKYGFINATGSVVIQPQYDDYINFINGYAMVAIEGKYGIIDPQGHFVINPQYDAIGDEVSADGYFVCLENGFLSIKKIDGTTVGTGYEDVAGQDYWVMYKLDTIVDGTYVSESGVKITFSGSNMTILTATHTTLRYTYTLDGKYIYTTNQSGTYTPAYSFFGQNYNGIYWYYNALNTIRIDGDNYVKQ